MATRRAIKNAVKAFIETNVPGVKTIHVGRKKDDVTKFPAVFVRTPSRDEERATLPARYGRKRLKTTVKLVVVDLDPSRDAEEGELRFDDLIDDIEAVIRDVVTIAGVESVWLVGDEIRTKVAEPLMAGATGGNVHRGATIEFEVIEDVVG